MAKKCTFNDVVNWMFIFAGLFCLGLLLTQGFGDSDYYWHITLGRDILAGKFSYVDTYSWLSAISPLTETAHSWLSGVILWIFTYLCGGYIGGGIYCFVTALIFAILTYCLDVRKVENVFQQTILSIILAVIIPMLFMDARPQNLGYILFTIAMHTLFNMYKEPKIRHIINLGICSLLWANLHGGTIPMLFAFEILVFIASFIKADKFNIFYNQHADCRVIRKYSLISLVVSVSAGLINPYGISLYWYFFITNNSATKQGIAEWMPMALLAPACILVILTCIYICIRRKKVPFLETVFLLLTTIMGGLHSRISNYTLIFVCILLAEHFSKYPINYNKKISEIFAVIPLAVSMSCYVAYFVDNRFSTSLNNPVTAEVLEVLTENEIQHPYTSYNSGGYFIEKGIKSFIDSRADLFSAKNLEDASNLGRLHFDSYEEFTELVNKYDFDAFIIRIKDEQPLRFFLIVSDDWECIFTSKEFEVYIPNNL